MLLRWVARSVVRLVLRGREHTRAGSGAGRASTSRLRRRWRLGLISIWFDNGLHAAAAVGVLTAALAFAMQKAVTSFAGYFLILRGDIFSVGDRIVMGGVRGDVIASGFPAHDDSGDGPAGGDARRRGADVGAGAAVHRPHRHGHQRAVFDEPVYNYSRDFPFIWEELHVMVKYDVDTELAEQLVLDAARAQR